MISFVTTVRFFLKTNKTEFTLWLQYLYFVCTRNFPNLSMRSLSTDGGQKSGLHQAGICRYTVFSMVWNSMVCCAGMEIVKPGVKRL